MGIYGHIQPYIQAFACIYRFFIYIYICILLHLSVCLFGPLHLYIHVRIRPYKVFWQIPSVDMACNANIWICVMRTSTQRYG